MLDIALFNTVKHWTVDLIRLLDRPVATIDFETRSCISLKAVGGWLYSLHPSTEVMCLQYKLPGQKIQRWNMAHPELGIEESSLPEDLFSFIAAGGLVEAHNAFFERAIWRNVLTARRAWPEVPETSWRCSAAKASACSLPRALEDAAKALHLRSAKDMAGNKLMQRMSKPRQPRKDEVLAWMETKGLSGDYRRHKVAMAKEVVLWRCEPGDPERLWEYCARDVETEEELSLRLPDLPPDELALWQIDQQLNIRGAKFDRALAEAALACASEWRRVLNAELMAMTGIPAATCRAKVTDWLKTHENLELPDTAADTVEALLAGDDVEGRARRVLEILLQVNKTSTSKYAAILVRADEFEGIARDLLMFHGAGTGRWTGKGIQIHNFPRGSAVNTWEVYNGKEYSKFNMDRACDSILEAYNDVMTGRCTWDEALQWMYATGGDVMETLSSALRGAIVPCEGKDLLVADYSAIEARCVLWEAGAKAALEVFRRGGDIYCDMATSIYGYEVGKKTHPDERQFGKQAILGLGYGMGFVTFLLTCRRYSIHFSIAQCKSIMREHFEKYVTWVRDYLNPKREPLETASSYIARRRQAGITRKRLENAREKPSKIIHELALMKYVVDVYRAKYPEVKQMWQDQETAAMNAVRAWQDLVRPVILDTATLDEASRIEARDKIEGPEFKAGLVSWAVREGFLCCTLPSTRVMRYRDPKIVATKTSWGETKDSIRYMSVIVGGKWASTGTYGGKIVENITQAVARDIMAAAMLRSKKYKGHTVEGNIVKLHWEEATIYDIFMSIHDELVAEVPENEGSIKEFEALLAAEVPWAEGCPVAAEAYRMKRYRKP